MQIAGYAGWDIELEVGRLSVGLKRRKCGCDRRRLQTEQVTGCGFAGWKLEGATLVFPNSRILRDKIMAAAFGQCLLNPYSKL